MTRPCGSSSPAARPNNSARILYWVVLCILCQTAAANEPSELAACPAGFPDVCTFVNNSVSLVQNVASCGHLTQNKPTLRLLISTTWATAGTSIGSADQQQPQSGVELADLVRQQLQQIQAPAGVDVVTGPADGSLHSGEIPQDYAGWTARPESATALAAAAAELPSALLLGDPDLQWSDVLPSVRRLVSVYDGKLQALPYAVEVPLVLYRRDALRSIGAGPAQTWPELLLLLKQLQQQQQQAQQNGNGSSSGSGSGARGAPASGFCNALPPGCRRDADLLIGIYSSMAWGSVRVPTSREDLERLLDEQMGVEGGGTVVRQPLERALALYRSLMALAPPGAGHGACVRPSLALALAECAVVVGYGSSLKAAIWWLGKERGAKLQRRQRRRAAEVEPAPPARSRTLLGDEAAAESGGEALVTPLPGSISNSGGLAVAAAPGGDSAVVRGVYMGSDVLSYQVNGSAPLALQYAAWRAAAVALGAASSWVSVLTPGEGGATVYRESQLADVERWTSYGYDEYDIASYLSALRESLTGSLMFMAPRFPVAVGAPLLDVVLMTANEAAFGSASTTLLAQTAVSQLQRAYAANRSVILNALSLHFGLGVEPAEAAEAAGDSSGGGGGLHGAKLAGVIVGSVVATAALATALVLALWWGRRAAVALARVLNLDLDLRPPSLDGASSAAPGYGPDTTLMLTDVQDSTRLWEALPAVVMDASLSLHNDAFRQLLPRFRGYECHTEGDSFVLAFHTAVEAAAFALEIQLVLLQLNWPQELLDHELCAVVRQMPPYSDSNEGGAAAASGQVLPAFTSTDGGGAVAAAAAAAAPGSNGGLEEGLVATGGSSALGLSSTRPPEHSDLGLAMSTSMEPWGLQAVDEEQAAILNSDERLMKSLYRATSSRRPVGRSRTFSTLQGLRGPQEHGTWTAGLRRPARQTDGIGAAGGGARGGGARVSASGGANAWVEHRSLSDSRAELDLHGTSSHSGLVLDTDSTTEHGERDSQAQLRMAPRVPLAGLEAAGSLPRPLQAQGLGLGLGQRQGLEGGVSFAGTQQWQLQRQQEQQERRASEHDDAAAVAFLGRHRSGRSLQLPPWFGAGGGGGGGLSAPLASTNASSLSSSAAAPPPEVGEEASLRLGMPLMLQRQSHSQRPSSGRGASQDLGSRKLWRKSTEVSGAGNSNNQLRDNSRSLRLMRARNSTRSAAGTPTPPFTGLLATLRVSGDGDGDGDASGSGGGGSAAVAGVMIGGVDFMLRAALASRADRCSPANDDDGGGGGAAATADSRDSLMRRLGIRHYVRRSSASSAGGTLETPLIFVGDPSEQRRRSRQRRQQRRESSMPAFADFGEEELDSSGGSSTIEESPRSSVPRDPVGLAQASLLRLPAPPPAPLSLQASEPHGRTAGLRGAESSRDVAGDVDADVGVGGGGEVVDAAPQWADESPRSQRRRCGASAAASQTAEAPPPPPPLWPSPPPSHHASSDGPRRPHPLGSSQEHPQALRQGPLLLETGPSTSELLDQASGTSSAGVVTACSLINPHILEAPAEPPFASVASLQDPGRSDSSSGRRPAAGQGLPAPAHGGTAAATAASVVAQLDEGTSGGGGGGDPTDPSGGSQGQRGAELLRKASSELDLASAGSSFAAAAGATSPLSTTATASAQLAPARGSVTGGLPSRMDMSRWMTAWPFGALPSAAVAAAPSPEDQARPLPPPHSPAAAASDGAGATSNEPVGVTFPPTSAADFGRQPAAAEAAAASTASSYGSGDGDGHILGTAVRRTASDFHAAGHSDLAAVIAGAPGSSWVPPVVRSLRRAVGRSASAGEISVVVGGCGGGAVSSAGLTPLGGNLPSTARATTNPNPLLRRHRLVTEYVQSPLSRQGATTMPGWEEHLAQPADAAYVQRAATVMGMPAAPVRGGGLHHHYHREQQYLHPHPQRRESLSSASNPHTQRHPQLHRRQQLSSDTLTRWRSVDLDLAASAYGSGSGGGLPGLPPAQPPTGVALRAVQEATSGSGPIRGSGRVSRVSAPGGGSPSGAADRQLAPGPTGAAAAAAAAAHTLAAAAAAAAPGASSTASGTIPRRRPPLRSATPPPRVPGHSHSAMLRGSTSGYGPGPATGGGHGLHSQHIHSLGYGGHNGHPRESARVWGGLEALMEAYTQAVRRRGAAPGRASAFGSGAGGAIGRTRGSVLSLSSVHCGGGAAAADSGVLTGATGALLLDSRGLPDGRSSDSRGVAMISDSAVLQGMIEVAHGSNGHNNGHHNNRDSAALLPYVPSFRDGGRDRDRDRDSNPSRLLSVLSTALRSKRISRGGASLGALVSVGESAGATAPVSKRFSVLSGGRESASTVRGNALASGGSGGPATFMEAMLQLATGAATAHQLAGNSHGGGSSITGLRRAASPLSLLTGGGGGSNGGTSTQPLLRLAAAAGRDSEGSAAAAGQPYSGALPPPPSQQQQPFSQPQQQPQGGSMTGGAAALPDGGCPPGDPVSYSHVALHGCTAAKFTVGAYGASGSWTQMAATHVNRFPSYLLKLSRAESFGTTGNDSSDSAATPGTTTATATAHRNSPSGGLRGRLPPGFDGGRGSNGGMWSGGGPRRQLYDTRSAKSVNVNWQPQADAGGLQGGGGMPYGGGSVAGGSGSGWPSGRVNSGKRYAAAGFRMSYDAHRPSGELPLRVAAPGPFARPSGPLGTAAVYGITRIGSGAGRAAAALSYHSEALPVIPRARAELDGAADQLHTVEHEIPVPMALTGAAISTTTISTATGSAACAAAARYGVPASARPDAGLAADVDQAAAAAAEHAAATAAAAAMAAVSRTSTVERASAAAAAAAASLSAASSEPLYAGAASSTVDGRLEARPPPQRSSLPLPLSQSKQQQQLMQARRSFGRAKAGEGVVGRAVRLSLQALRTIGATVSPSPSAPEASALTSVTPTAGAAAAAAPPPPLARGISFALASAASGTAGLNSSNNDSLEVPRWSASVVATPQVSYTRSAVDDGAASASAAAVTAVSVSVRAAGPQSSSGRTEAPSTGPAAATIYSQRARSSVAGSTLDGYAGMPSGVQDVLSSNVETQAEAARGCKFNSEDGNPLQPGARASVSASDGQRMATAEIEPGPQPPDSSGAAAPGDLPSAGSACGSCAALALTAPVPALAAVQQVSGFASAASSVKAAGGGGGRSGMRRPVSRNPTPERLMAGLTRRLDILISPGGSDMPQWDAAARDGLRSRQASGAASLVGRLGAGVVQRIAPGSKKALGAQGTPLDGTICFRGFRVRCGMHSGLEEGRDVYWTKMGGRRAYSGPAMALAKAVSDLIPGGMVLLTAAAFDRLQPWPNAEALPGAIVWLRGRFRVGLGEASSGVAPAAEVDLYQLLSPQLLARQPALERRPWRGADQVLPGVLSAPLGRLALVLVQVAGVQVLRAWNSEVTAAALQVFGSVAAEMLPAWGGFPASLDVQAGTLLAAFREPALALGFMHALIDVLSDAEWPPELLSHELGEALLMPAAGPGGAMGGAGVGIGGGGGGFSAMSDVVTATLPPMISMSVSGAPPQPPPGEAGGGYLFRGLRLRCVADVASVRVDLGCATAAALYEARDPKAFKSLRRMLARAHMGAVLCSGLLVSEVLSGPPTALAALHDLLAFAPLVTAPPPPPSLLPSPLLGQHASLTPPTPSFSPSSLPPSTAPPPPLPASLQAELGSLHGAGGATPIGRPSVNIVGGGGGAATAAGVSGVLAGGSAPPPVVSARLTRKEASRSAVYQCTRRRPVRRSGMGRAGFALVGSVGGVYGAAAGMYGNSLYGGAAGSVHSGGGQSVTGVSGVMVGIGSG